MNLEVFEMVEEVALQRPCFAVVGTSGMLAWIRPDPIGLEGRGVAVFVRRGWWIVVVC